MSYRRPWLLDPGNTAQPGGAHGGGATLSAFGQKLVDRYRAIAADTRVTVRSTCAVSSRPLRLDRQEHQQPGSDGLALASNLGAVGHLTHTRDGRAAASFRPCHELHGPTAFSGRLRYPREYSAGPAQGKLGTSSGWDSREEVWDESGGALGRVVSHQTRARVR
jgi:hypothetical protein